jgi:3-oxoacyl-[acyl-carrier protein] reductase
MLLKGKVALVTGGSRGLGRVDALALAEAGADVVIADIVMEGEEKTSQEIKAMGKRSFVIKMDVTDRDEVKEGVARIKKELGSIDILVNSAATLDHLGQILEQKNSGRGIFGSISLALTIAPERPGHI